MIGLVFATQEEARPFLKLVDARKTADGPFLTYGFVLAGAKNRSVAVVSGMGKVAAALATQYLILVHRVTEVVNAGVCGAVADGLRPGQVFCVSQVQEGDRVERDGSRTVYPTSRGGFVDLPAARLITVDRPVCDAKARDRAVQGGELVDMEGAAVARACMLSRVNVHLVKVVSDLADESAREDIQKNLPAVCEELAKILRDGLFKMGPGAYGMVQKLIRFIRVEHTVFSLPLLFAGAWIGAGNQLASWKVLLLVVLAGLGARTLGMAMNRILDRDLDARNPRTANRELPTGRISLAGAYGVAMLGLAVYLLACILLGRTCTLLSPIPAAMLIFYSYLKRWTSLCHFGIGSVMALAPLGAYVAATDGPVFALQLNLEIILLAVFAFCWISAFDIIYALQDLESDRLTGIKSLPVKLGPGLAQWTAASVHTVGLGSMAALVVLSAGGILAWGAFSISLLAIGLAYVPWIPLSVRFFPLSAIAGIFGALVPFTGGLA